MELSSGTNVFYGKNAQGKTNILEALALLSDGKSFRGARRNELIRHDESRCVVEGTISGDTGEKELKIQISNMGKTFYLNKKKLEGISDFVGNAYFVVFSSDSLNISSGEPRYRRQFIDRGIFSLVPEYLNLVREYHRVIRHRNSVLRHPSPDRTLLQTWTARMLTTGARIVAYRMAYIQRLQPLVRDYHERLSGKKEALQIRYRSDIDYESDDYRDIYMRLGDAVNRLETMEMKRGTTLAGPHRDDLNIFLNDRSVRIYGSRGQKRTCVLALKLAELELYRATHREYPMLVLDDIGAELDTERLQALFRLIPEEAQRFVSATALPGGICEGPSGIFEVESGRVRKIKMHEESNGGE